MDFGSGCDSGLVFFLGRWYSSLTSRDVGIGSGMKYRISIFQGPRTLEEFYQDMAPDHVSKRREELSKRYGTTDVVITEAAPKLPLVRTLGVELAAIKNRALFVVIKRATPEHVAEMRAAFGSRLGEDHYAHISQWHVALVVGECLTRKGAQNQAKREIESGYEAEVIEYSAAEVRASLK